MRLLANMFILRIRMRLLANVYFVDFTFDVCFFYKVHVPQQKPPSRLQKEI